MGFNSLEFVFLFLPCFLGCYYLFSPKWRNTVLALGSMVFYLIGVWKQPWCLVLLAAEVMLIWITALFMPHFQEKRRLLIGCLALLFGALLIFKYAGLLGAGLALPLGVSFYSFQLAAYLIDVYRKRVEPSPLLRDFAAGILMFPKLLSGPLMDPGDLRHQLAGRRDGLESFDRGLREFIIGLALKVLLADRVGGLWTQVKTIGFESISTPMAWMGLAGYCFQLYFDFWGYSRMATGLGRMMGFRLPRNFDHPYAARSMTEFWRRWHITLGAWFRDYIYIPLGGSRQGLPRTICNLLVVWLLTGIWHGSTWNFLLWGLFLFCLIALEKLGLGRVLDRHRFLSRIYMLLVIPLSWLLFAVPDLPQIGVYFSRLFPFFGDGIAVNPSDFIRYGKQYGLFLLLGFLLSSPWPERIWNRVRASALGTVLCLLLFWGAVYCMAVATNDPFLYFSF